MGVTKKVGFMDDLYSRYGGAST